jgi:hypothetical protein
VFVTTPAAEHGHIAGNPEEIVLGVYHDKDKKDTPVFMLFVGSNPPTADEKHLTSMQELLDHLQARLNKMPGERVEVSINAEPDVKAGVVRDLTAKLEYPPFRDRIKKKFIGVSEKES